MAALEVDAIYNQVVSHAQSLGVFERLVTHEPSNAPGNGLSAAIWYRALEPVAEVSGLAATSARLEVTIRLYENMLVEPQDGIDKSLLKATDQLMAAYIGDFELGGTAMHVDVLGAYGDGLKAEGGYLKQDSTLYRVSVITLPIIIADLWSEAP